MSSKLREVLEDAEKTLSDSSRSLYGIPPHLHELLTRIRSALAEPLRNYEVGTAKEQDKRFTEFCNQFDGCVDCIIRHKKGVSCSFLWLQMPYEEGCDVEDAAENNNE